MHAKSSARMLGRIANSPSKTLICWSGSVVVGVAAHALDERLWFRPDVGSLMAGLAAAFVIVGITSVARTRLVVLAAAFSVLAVLRYDVLLAERIVIASSSPPETSSSFTGTVASAPVERTDRTVVSFKDVRSVTGTAYSGEVRVTVGVGMTATPRYGDVVRWTCRPEPVDRHDGEYGTYLFSRGIGWTCRTYGMEVVGASRVNPIVAGVQAFRARVLRSASRLFHEPDASMVLGLLVGAEEGLPSSVTDAFRDAGVSHILAVSGYNVVQLVRLLTLAFGIAGLSRRTGAAMSGGGVVLFAILVGDDASVVRAAVMGCIMTLAAIYGRRYSGSVALPLAAALMLLAEPLALRHDAGFLLSFCAVIGLHVFAPPLQAVTERIIPWKTVSSLVSETSAATIATLPVILVLFGRVPLVALPANVAILPFIPFIMAMGALALLLGAISPMLAFPFVAMTDLLLRFVVEPSRIAAGLPVPSIEADIGPMGAAVLATFLVALAIALSIRARRSGDAPYAPL